MQTHSRSIGACPSTPSSSLMLFSSTTKAGPLTSSPAPLPNAKYMLVAFIDTRIRRIRHLPQISNTTPYVALDKMQSTLL